MAIACEILLREVIIAAMDMLVTYHALRDFQRINYPKKINKPDLFNNDNHFIGGYWVADGNPISPKECA
ncbi:hypothetical protein NIES25_19040 [Nostoc linckia NIES-25]|nr:hypothetical protein NIES25_19040 [Nostoc linckia NIES-25]